MSVLSDSYPRALHLGKAHGAKPGMFGDVFQSFGMNGDNSGTTFFYSLAVAAAVVGTINVLNVISRLGMHLNAGLLAPVIDEGSSWLTFIAFFWIVWLGWRFAPPGVRPRWKLLIHIPMAVAFCAAHVGGFLLLRTFAYGLAGQHYDIGPLFLRFWYEFSKDAFGYLLFLAGIALVDHLLHRQKFVEVDRRPATFDIRVGAKVSRVKLDEILAVCSAGNYVEFVLRSGKRLLMRSALSALEHQLEPRGFLRTHRSWLVNAGQVTAINPESSGDYAIKLETLVVPLSRRFPAALAKLRCVNV
jgi:hypothetical protein